MTVAGKGGRPLGLSKTGGRKRGTRNKSTLEVEKKLRAFGCDLICVLAQICMDKKFPVDARIRCAIELSSYLHPKRRPIEENSSQPSTYEVKTVVEAGTDNSGVKDDENGK
jgi:hypothetical protein